MINLTKDEKERIEVLESRLSTFIPGNISIVAWPLPLLEKVIDRLERIELRLERLERDMPGGIL